MASRWFVFWIACFVVSALSDEALLAVLWLVFAGMTGVPPSVIEKYISYSSREE